MYSKYSHTSFGCLFVLAAWMFGSFGTFVGAFFRTRNILTCANVCGRLFLERRIFIHFIRLFICAVRLFIVLRLIICERRSFHLCECLWPPFLERGIFIHFIRLFIICAVSDRRHPRQLGDSSRIVTIRQLFQG